MKIGAETGNRSANSNNNSFGKRELREGGRREERKKALVIFTNVFLKYCI